MKGEIVGPKNRQQHMMLEAGGWDTKIVAEMRQMILYLSLSQLASLILNSQSQYESHITRRLGPICYGYINVQFPILFLFFFLFSSYLPCWSPSDQVCW